MTANVVYHTVRKPSEGCDVHCLQTAPHGFQNSMKVEVVDRRNPMLIRVASIVDNEDYRVKVSKRTTETPASHPARLGKGHVVTVLLNICGHYY